MLDEGLLHRNSSSAAADAEHEEFPRMSAARVERLETLIRLRKLYRNLLRADRLLAQPIPVYQLPKRPGAPSLAQYCLGLERSARSSICHTRPVYPGAAGQCSCVPLQRAAPRRKRKRWHWYLPRRVLLVLQITEE